MNLTDKERDALNSITKFEDNLPPNAFDAGKGDRFQLGWSWRDVHIYPATLNGLVVKDCLETLFKSNSYTGYKLTNEGRVLLTQEISEATEKHYTAKLELPNDLFDVITGYDDVKGLFIKSLKGEPTDVLLCGVPGSSKTMFLSELEHIGGATPTILGGTASKVGIIDILFEEKPTLLLLDEFEHLNTRDYTVLLSLCENRIISETKHGKTRRLELPNTRIFAGCNSTHNIPTPVLDRMQVIHFRSYTRAEFMQVVINVLTKRMSMENTLAEYIAQVTWEFSHSVRQAIRIAKIAKTREEVDSLLEVIQKYSG